MKSHVPIAYRVGSKAYTEITERANEIGQERFRKVSEAAMRKWFMLLAVSLNEMFGFGQKRLVKLFLEIANLIRIHDDEDIEFWTHVERRCAQLKVLKYLNGEKDG